MLFPAVVSDLFCFPVVADNDYEDLSSDQTARAIYDYQGGECHCIFICIFAINANQ